jgi:hypothetical protein
MIDTRMCSIASLRLKSFGQNANDKCEAASHLQLTALLVQYMYALTDEDLETKDKTLA